jgi:predicted nucleic acid-binding protein
MDDRVARQAAEARGLLVVGTLNVLEASAERDLLDLSVAIDKLRRTNFHLAEEILAQALTTDAERRRRLSQ